MPMHTAVQCAAVLTCAAAELPQHYHPVPQCPKVEVHGTMGGAQSRQHGVPPAYTCALERACVHRLTVYLVCRCAEAHNAEVPDWAMLALEQVLAQESGAHVRHGGCGVWGLSVCNVVFTKKWTGK